MAESKRQGGEDSLAQFMGGGTGSAGGGTRDRKAAPPGASARGGDAQADAAAEAMAALSQLRTGEDVMTFFVRYAENCPVKFLHLNPVRHATKFQPYSLVVVPEEEVLPEHFTMSAKGVVHVCPGRPSEFTSLSEWSRFSSVFSVIRSVPFFRDFLAHKAFKSWAAFSRFSKYRRQRRAVAARLFSATPTFAPAVAEIMGIVSHMQSTALLDTSSWRYTLSSFAAAQSKAREVAGSVFFSDISRIIEVLRGVCEDVTKRASAGDADGGGAGAAISYSRDNKHKSMQQLKAEARARRDALRKAREEESRLGALIRFVDYACVEALTDLVISEFERLLQSGLNYPGDDPRKKSGCFLTAVRFEAGGTVFVPPRDSLLSMLEMVEEGTITVCNSTARVLDAKIFKPFVAELPRQSHALASPPVATLLSESRRYARVMAGIQDKVVADFDSAREHANNASFRDVRPVFDFKLMLASEAGGAGGYYARLTSKSPEELKRELSRIASWATAVSEIRSQQVCGSVYVDGKPLQQELEPVVQDALSGMKQQLNDLAVDKAQEVLEQLAARATALAQDPTDLQSFAAFVEKCNTLGEEEEDLMQSAAQVEAMFTTLQQFGVKLGPSDTMKLKEMQDAREAYSEARAEASSFISSNLSEKKKQLDVQTINMSKSLAELENTLAEPHFTQAEHDPPEVLEALAELRNSLGMFEDASSKYGRWQGLFSMPSSEMKALSSAQSAWERVHDLWSSLHKWNSLYTEWTHNTTWTKVDVKRVSEDTARLFKKAFKLDKSMGNEVSRLLKNRVSDFKQHLPVIEELGNTHLKPRHWKQIFEQCGQEFTDGILAHMKLATLMAFDVFSYREMVTEVSGTASGEAALEAGVTEIATAWQDMELPTKAYGDSKNVYILDALEDITTLLEDHQVKLQSMMGSRFIQGVRSEVESWDKRLAVLSETLDEWLSVQSNWRYLETIFSAEDIQRQLPTEAQKFSTVDKKWKEVMLSTHTNPSVLHAVGSDDSLLRTFQNSNKLLEEIQKSLEDYLETKRAGFARFYFLSNDELLQILSQTRDPKAVQPHLGKCFDNMKELQFGSDEAEHEMFGMVSNEGEQVRFSAPVSAAGNVEDWLGDVETMMRTTLYDSHKAALAAYPTTEEGAINRGDWLFKWPAQVVLTIDQIAWTARVVQALKEIASGQDPSALQAFLDMVLRQIDAMVTMVRGQNSKQADKLLGALLVIDVHGRDVLRAMIAKKVATLEDFEWTRQLRYYWENAVDNVVVRQTNARFIYGYEYLGNSPRLVITPLTDKCYMTLTGALHLKFGGAPAGPAGTGKTETVKDLGKAMAVQCVVFNCSDGLDYRMMGRFFSGLAMAGAWACFDEFNRIDIEVLSVIAQQILTIQQGLMQGAPSIEFEGREINLSPSFGVFITMNPGYAGRTELPDNLKALFRPVAMMVPDYRLIAEIILFSQGFADAFSLSSKMAQLYKLSSEQLSQQKHYDFGMRAVKSVLVAAGQLKRKEPTVDENMLLIRAMRDSNVPKFLQHDLPLFHGIVSDLFPGVNVPYVDYGLLQEHIEEQLRLQGYQVVPDLVTKCIQVHETQLVRHGMMVVGTAFSGKSVATRTLQLALMSLKKQGVVDKDGFYQRVEVSALNPKSITMGELYGYANSATGEWQDGLVASLVRHAAEDSSSTRKWVLFDGPVDALWIENMNTVLDDNKLLCLPNGERIKLPSSMHMLFEVEDLEVASPATVSRCGMVYMEPVHVGMMPLVHTWAAGKIGDLLPEEVPRIVQLLEKHIPQLVRFVRRKGTEKVVTTDMNLVMSCLAVLSALLSPENGVRGSGWKKQPRTAAEKARAAAGLTRDASKHSAEQEEDEEGDSDLQRSVTGDSALSGGGVSGADDDEFDSAEDDAEDTGANKNTGVLPEDVLERAVNVAYTFAVTWSFGCNLHDGSRRMFNDFVKSLLAEDKVLPAVIQEDGADLFDVCMNTEELLASAPGASGEGEGKASAGDALMAEAHLVTWDSMTPQFHYALGSSYFSLLVPTMDTVRYSYIFKLLVRAGRPVLFSGDTGVGKSVIATAAMQELSEGDNAPYIFTTVNFSAQTMSRNLQEVFEDKLDKRRKNLLGPPSGKTMIVFVDDLNMPAKEEYGAQPPIELLRQVVDQGAFYDRQKLFLKNVADCVFAAACAPPGGGRNDVTKRLTRHFHHVWLTALSTPVMYRIFGAILNGFLGVVAPDLMQAGRGVVQAAVRVYNTIAAELRPTPAKSHYTFNLRDLSKVFQGMLMVDHTKLDSPDKLYRLWVHEEQRVFRDRLIDDVDGTWFNKLVSRILMEDLHSPALAASLGVPLLASEGKAAAGAGDSKEQEDTEVNADLRDVLFGDYLERDTPQYQEVLHPEKLGGLFKEYLEEYNVESKNQMHLVFFADAISHVSRIARILRQPRGNALLVGVGGSGRQSLTRLAAFIQNYTTVNIEITRHYDKGQWYEDLKRFLMMAGVQGQPTVFLFSDTQIVHESFLEDINNILNTGDVPNLYAVEDYEVIMADVRKACKALGRAETRDNILATYIERVRDNFHIVLAMSPIGSAFRTRCRMFPALVNCCTIDWFSAWPEDALFSVASSFLMPHKAEVGGAAMVHALCDTCVAIHRSVEVASVKFLATQRRYNYTTPTSYLELIRLYQDMLGEQRFRINERISKYTNGLDKLQSANDQVKDLQEQLKVLQPQLKKSAAETEVLLKQLAIDKAAADQAREVAARDEAETAKVAANVRSIKDDCQRDLDKALPAYNSAIKALKSLDKRHIQEVKSFAKPAATVVLVMEAVQLLLKRGTKWEDARRSLNEMDFLEQLEKYDKDNIDPKVIRKLVKYINDPEFDPDRVGNVSTACKSLCLWCRAMYNYDAVAKNIEPKRAKLAGAEAELAEAQATLAAKQAELAEIEGKLAQLQRTVQEKQAYAADLGRQQELTTVRLGRAHKLTDGLADEAVRWKESAAQLQVDRTNLVGNILLAAGCIAYEGPFTADFRQQLTAGWVSKAKAGKIPVDPQFSLTRVLADPVVVREWQLMGLPADDFSTQNGLFTARGRRWPLAIDPQGQANRWIRRMHREDGLSVIKLSQSDFLRTLENAIQFGQPVLLENVEEELDPSLEPVLLKQVFKKGGLPMIRLGDSDIQYSNAFKFYITTKMANPHYLPEVCVKVTVINMTVTQRGLEDQLLVDVVKHERPELESRKDALIVSIASDKKQLADIESKILKMLAESSGDLLDDDELINQLAASKRTSAAIGERMTEAERTTKDIQQARELYRPVATRGSLLYSAIADLAGIDPMYQYSLQAFTRLYNMRIERSEASDDLDTRLSILNTDLTWSFFVNVCRGLFNRHKTLYAFMIGTSIARHMGDIAPEEWAAFTIGPVLNGDAPPKPAGVGVWLAPKAWSTAQALAQSIPVFKGLCGSLETSARDWQQWAEASPAQQPPPAPWGEQLTAFQQLLLLRVLKEELTYQGVVTYITNTLGGPFVEPPPLDLEGAFGDSTAATPLIFVLSPGADPIDYLIKLAKDKGVNFQYISLGQGQGPNAERKMEAARRNGDWVCLQNCHLAVSWLPRLEAILEETSGTDEHPDYRLWLTSMPSKAFPVPVLQTGIKLTQEPPAGLKANLKRTFLDISAEQYEACSKPRAFKKLLFGLAFYHALILERRQFGAIGWNIPYEWMNSDLKTGMMQLKMYLEEQPMVPYETLNSVVGDITYGGRATDAWDKRTNLSVLRRYFTPEALDDSYQYVAGSDVYRAPAEGDLESVRAYIETLPLDDAPEVFGLHPNASISLQAKVSGDLMGTLISVQPVAAAGDSGGKSADEIVSELAAGYEATLPAALDVNAAHPKSFETIADGSMNSMGVFLNQECERFNRLLGVMKSSLNEAQRALRGEVLLSAELEAMHNAMTFQQVPALWEAVAYPSLKPLASWFKDLVARVEALNAWLRGGPRASYWISGFFFPQGFLTGALQTHSRKTHIAIDTLAFATNVTKMTEADITSPPEDGVYVHGLFLQGARWNTEAGVVEEMHPAVLFYRMPAIALVPALRAEVDPIADSGKVYTCPVYKTSLRAGTLSTTGHSTNFVMSLHLPSKEAQDHWIRRGVAMLSQLDD